MTLKPSDYEFSRQEVAEILGTTVNIVARIEKEALEKIQKALDSGIESS